MSTGIDISIQKLSAPLETLNLDRRAYNGMKRSSFYTVAEILLAGKPRLQSGKNIGTLTVSRILEAVAAYLGVPESDLAIGNCAQPGSSSDAWEAPTGVLPLPATTLHSLRSLGFLRIADLVKCRAIGYDPLRGLEPNQVYEIDRALSRYFAREAHLRLLPLVGPAAILEHPVPEPQPVPNLKRMLPPLRLNERAWYILELRALQFLTQKEIGIRLGGPSKEGVRQILEQAYRDARQKLIALSPCLDQFETTSKILWTSLGKRPLDLSALVVHLLPDPSHSDIEIGEQEMQRMIILIRTLAMNHGPWFVEEVEPRWPALIFLSCLVEPAITSHEQVGRIVKEREFEKKRKTYKALSYSVLGQAGKPMHWIDIAEHARELNNRGFFNARSLHKDLQHNKMLFVLVGPGTYALAEWGRKGAKIIAEKKLHSLVVQADDRR